MLLKSGSNFFLSFFLPFFFSLRIKNAFLYFGECFLHQTDVKTFSFTLSYIQLRKKKKKKRLRFSSLMRSHLHMQVLSSHFLDGLDLSDQVLSFMSKS